MTTVIIFIAALSLLVFVHEWGHFIIAKLSGVRVDVFSIGFGPKLFGFTWHGTEYRIAPIPFGGYVRIFGQEPLEEAEGDIEKAEEIARDPASFSSKPLYKKFGVVFAGPVMNLVLCFALMPLCFMIGRLQPKLLEDKPVIIDVVDGSPAQKAGIVAGDLVLSVNGYRTNNWEDLKTQILLHPDVVVDVELERQGDVMTLPVPLVKHEGVKQTVGYMGVEFYEFHQALIGEIVKGSPAEKAGIQKDDVVKSVNGTAVTYWKEIPAMIQNNKDQPLNLVLARGGADVAVTVTPEYSDKLAAWIIGINQGFPEGYYVKKRYGFVEAVILGTQKCVELFDLTFDILGRLFTGNLSVRTLGGPLQIAMATSSAAKSGIGEFIFLLAFLSMQLGIMNLLPIPVLDGGHIVFMGIEGIRRKPLSFKFRSVTMQVGLVVLLGLMLFVTINDVDSIWGFSRIIDSIKSFF
ncbi:MAG: RIP metalloprotease RseP [Deltaproteobacteria bacterium]|nr:RIP metalloprotease RseP [Deltaproteobacteria bacterium]